MPSCPLDMQIQREGGFLDNIAEILTRELFDEDGVDGGEYISGEDLVNISLPNKSKTWYYGEQAADRGTLETIREYIEPVGYKVDFSKTKSAWLGTTSDATVFFVDLSLVQLLAQGNSMGRIPGKHSYEIFVLGDSTMASELKAAINQTLEE